TTLRAMPWWFSNSSPACSNTRFLLLASRSMTTLDRGRSWAIRLIGSSPARHGKLQMPRGRDGRVSLGDTFRKTRELYPHPKPKEVVKGSQLAVLVLQRFVVVVLDLLLVLLHLAVELVDHRVDGRVHVAIVGFDEDVLAARAQRHFRLLVELVHRQDHADADHIVEVANDAVELRAHVVADGRGDFDVMPGDGEIHDDSYFSDQIVLRILTGGILSDSRYLAMVRRATTIPCWPNRSAILASDRGFFLSSASTSWRISARIAVEDAAPPVSVAT